MLDRHPLAHAMSGSVQVFGRLRDDLIHARRRQAYEKRQGTKSRLCGAPHNRDYAERTIMQSRGGKLLPAARVSLLSLHIIRLASGCVQHRQDFVGGAEATGLQHWRRHRCERFELFARIGSQIDLCTLQAGVSEPK